MKKIITSGMPLVVFAIALCGCEHTDNERAGEVVGGGSGALIGAQIGAGTGQLVGVGVGAVVGALAGGAVAHEADKKYELQKSDSAGSALPKPLHSTYEKKRSAYRVLPRSPHTPPNTKCAREYTYQGFIDGKPVKIHGTAHMKADGTWYVPDSLHADDLKD